MAEITIPGEAWNLPARLWLNAVNATVARLRVIPFRKTLYRAMPPLIRRRLGLPGKWRAGRLSGLSSSLSEQMFLARVTRISRETARAATIEFELLDGYRFNYRAGQCVAISIAVGGVLFQRCFTLSSVPDENRYSITVQKVFNGRVSTWLNETLKAGDHLYVSNPAGGFVLPADAAEDQCYLMVAGGSGIVPVYALIKDLLGKNPAAEIQLTYFSPTPEQCIFRKELERLDKLHEGLSVHFHFTHKDGQNPDPARYLTSEGVQALLARMSDPSRALCYLSGPNSLTRICLEVLRGLGVDEARIRIELFNRSPLSLIQMELEPRQLTLLPGSVLGKVRRVQQRKVETLLESVVQAGGAIPQKCTVGNCQTCKVKMLAGSVIMDEPNSLSLEDARNGYVLSCVAYPCEDVVLQLPRR